MSRLKPSLDRFLGRSRDDIVKDSIVLWEREVRPDVESKLLELQSNERTVALTVLDVVEARFVAVLVERTAPRSEPRRPEQKQPIVLKVAPK